MGLTVFDYDDDGCLDLFQGNDHQLNFLFHDKGDGTFEEVACDRGSRGERRGTSHRFDARFDRRCRWRRQRWT